MDSNLSLAFYKLHVFRQINLSGASSNWKTSKTDDKMISKKKKMISKGSHFTHWDSWGPNLQKEQHLLTFND